jgi:tetratricopeptide (TPR) repeat protein
MNLRIFTLALLLVFAAVCFGVNSSADDAAGVDNADEIESFDGWSWKDRKKAEAEKKTQDPAATGSAAPAAQSPAPKAIEVPAVLDALAAEPAEPAMDKPLKPVRDAQASTIDPGRYEKLVKDNLDLRVQRDALGDQLEALKRENAKLNVKVREVESKHQEMATVLQELDTAGKSTTALEQKMSLVDAERQRLQRERDDLQVRAKNLEAALVEAKAKIEAAPGAESAQPAMANVREDSPLFTDLQKDKNALEMEKRALEKQARELEGELEKMRTVTARDETEKIDAATRTLQDRLSEEEAHRVRDGRSKSEMARRVMKMRAELEGLTRVIKGKDAKIGRQDKLLRAAAVELRRKHWQMDYAGKTMKTLNQATMDVRHSQNREMLNVHYNAGVMYTERGQFDDARLSYLRALAINPADADVHYNLAILYDDHYRDLDRAYVHLQKYLQFNPQGDDADVVKAWLTEIELKIR